MPGVGTVAIMQIIAGGGVIKAKIIRWLFYKYFYWRMDKLLVGEYQLLVDYPVHPKPRYGYGKPAHGKLHEIIDRNRDDYKRYLTGFLQYKDDFSRIAEIKASEDSPAPSFINNWFMGLDAVALYGFLSINNPGNYLEIGSGNSTKFARRAITDRGLRTKITSIDPVPRSHIDSISDRCIRQPLEEVGLSLFDTLEAGDILFVDNSHRVFTNSDCTVVFLEILPRLKAGVLVHFHDIMLPLDYPPQWNGRYYSEQYLLACYLLADGNKVKVLLPNAFISMDKELTEAIDPLWSHGKMRDVERHALARMGRLGYSFWVKVK